MPSSCWVNPDDHAAKCNGDCNRLYIPHLVRRSTAI